MRYHVSHRAVRYVGETATGLYVVAEAGMPERHDSGVFDGIALKRHDGVLDGIAFLQQTS